MSALSKPGEDALERPGPSPAPGGHPVGGGGVWWLPFFACKSEQISAPRWPPSAPLVPPG